MISETLIDSYFNLWWICFNMLREYNEMEEDIKNPEDFVEYPIWK